MSLNIIVFYRIELIINLKFSFDTVIIIFTRKSYSYDMARKGRLCTQKQVLNCRRIISSVLYNCYNSTPSFTFASKMFFVRKLLDPRPEH